eukprot:2134929-Amphidinium_carterae.1
MLSLDECGGYVAFEGQAPDVTLVQSWGSDEVSHREHAPTACFAETQPRRPEMGTKQRGPPTAKGRVSMPSISIRQIRTFAAIMCRWCSG